MQAEETASRLDRSEQRTEALEELVAQLHRRVRHVEEELTALNRYVASLESRVHEDVD